MGTPLNQLNSAAGSYTPIFEKKLIEKDREDGYWIETFQVDSKSPVGLVAFGLGSGDLKLYQNLSTIQEPGKGIFIQNLDVPVAIDQADITDNGFNNVIVCYKYGKTMLDTDPEGGIIVWLENPGSITDNKSWKDHYVGKSTAMHRLRVGHFTQTKRWEIIGFPVVSRPYDLYSPVPVFLFRQPDNVLNATEWPHELITQDYFSVIHDSVRINDGQLDSILIASNEGISLLYFDQNSNQWIIKHIGDGEKDQKQQIGFHGSGGMHIGRIKDDPFAYIPAIEPFHGNVISVYVKDTNSSLRESQWERYILDVYGYPNESGESSGHYVVCADFDKDGDDEFLVAHRGPPPNQGVFFYKPIDISRGLFAKWKISDDSVARIAIADFDNDNAIDFATITYTVAGYYEAPNPSIDIFYNRFAQKQLRVEKEIQVTKQNNDLLFKVPRPHKALQYEELPFLTINGLNLSLAIVPPHSSRSVDQSTYIKVLSGTIMWSDSGKGTQEPVEHSRIAFTEPRTIAPLDIHSDNPRVRTGDDGALLIVFKTRDNVNGIQLVEDMKKLILENSLPEYFPEDVRQFSFQFHRYDKYDSRPQFKDLEFYNMKGIRIDFLDNNENLCYMQFWAAGQGVNAGIHNHATDTFCEIHVCLVNGSGKGGMHYLSSSKEAYDPLTTLDSTFKQLPLPAFYEHGPLWDIDAQNKPVVRSNGTVVYPWHKWQAGIDTSWNQSFDIWVVFEFNNRMSALPFTSASTQRFIPNMFNVFFAILLICIQSELLRELDYFEKGHLN
ncbi:unnamed protein product [Rotaria magnacalcarata]|uniref:Aldos-2-ulose dehydratase/isomerase (AUDH) Cupin domain-containing protein n=1 Tax=Rotaria magnacalcarata TaxID=392030 RepID=A0A819QW97_9BILA|nr:unnamed protein product [Rotaria magnacalcarata]CAF4038103.1 unnamed protein product [Rotaria magnacalcarata]